MKNRIINYLFVIMIICAFSLVGCTKKQEYPQIAYIDNVTYYGTNEVCSMVPRKAPDGVIETFVSPEIMPDAYNSANFGSEQGQIEYMFTDDGKLILHIGEEWYYFE